jgi:hypothetical protein
MNLKNKHFLTCLSQKKVVNILSLRNFIFGKQRSAAMKKLLLATALIALAGSAAPAHAAVIDVTLGSTPTSLSYSTVGGGLSPNVNLLTLGGNLTTSNASIINPASSSTGLYTQPTGPIYGDNYLAVFGVPTTGTATITLGANINTLGFTWGTIDDYNSLIIKTSQGVTYTITGDDILSQIAGSVDHTTQANVQFTDPGGTILSAELTSTQNSFEAANFEEVNSVPLPGAFSLFALAMAGLIFFGWRKSKDVA